MPLRNYTSFKGFDQIGKSLLTTELENNLKTFLDWALLGVGAWNNVSGVPQSGAYGGDFSRLRPVDDPHFTDGQVWETIRKEWVWETGVEWQNGTGDQPIQISGVYVDGTFYSTGDATYGHHYNYPLGRVVFDTPIPQTSTVQANYSYRWAQIYRSVDAQWWRELQFNTLRPDDSQFLQDGSGAYDVLAHHRIQMPCVIIEAVGARRGQPYELGNGSINFRQQVQFHVFAETAWERNQLIDAISYQDDKVIYIYDSDDVVEKGNHALDHRGMLRPEGKMYPDYVASTGEGGSRNKRMRFVDTIQIDDQQPDQVDPRLWQGKVQTDAEVIVGSI